ncbi:pseudouridine synthase [Celeribacter sp.]|uniref:pseudouridine synthase n=1 Tax=Celeribacter sp. TaxID=1890673 RepID=UPI003A8F32AD
MTDKTPKSDRPKSYTVPKKSAPKDRAKPAAPSTAKSTPPGDRIAKVLARAGIASRRDAETMIEEGRVTVNGRKVLSPALNVLKKDRITVDGQPVGEPEPPRLWIYHKPTGLVTTEKDEKGRETVFGNLPEGLPRVMSVGRLDLNSEGLLLLTNDGELKRKLELPDTGWLRKYRVRVKGTASEATLDTLRKGITIDGENFQPMEVVFDRQQGANAWLTVGIREGKNREIRRAMEHIGLTVNRLIRISYGPFRLNQIKPGEVEEVRYRVLRDQLGLEDESFGDPKRGVSRGGDRGGKSFDKKPFGKPAGKRDGGGRDGGGRDGERKPFRKDGDRPFRKDGDRKPFGKPDGKRDGKPDGKPGARRDGKPGGFKSHGYKSHGGGKGSKPRSAGFKSHGDAGSKGPRGKGPKRDG